MAWPLAAGGSAQRLAATRLGGTWQVESSLLYVSCVLFYVSKASKSNNLIIINFRVRSYRCGKGVKGKELGSPF